MVFKTEIKTWTWRNGMKKLIINSSYQASKPNVKSVVYYRVFVHSIYPYLNISGWMGCIKPGATPPFASATIKPSTCFRYSDQCPDIKTARFSGLPSTRWCDFLAFNAISDTVGLCTTRESFRIWLLSGQAHGRSRLFPWQGPVRPVYLPAFPIPRNSLPVS